MRILIHDFGGYAFLLQLSRVLARRGHRVLHVYCASLQSTPPGVIGSATEPDSLEVRGLDLGGPLRKYSFFARWRQENAYGRMAAQAADDFAPDVVLSANTPLDAQRRLLRACRRRGVRFVFSLQDLIGVATRRLLSDKLGTAGRLIGTYYVRMERKLLRGSDAVVPITEAFRPMLRSWGVDDHRIHVIENWAPLDDVSVRSKDNPWAHQHHLTDKRCLLYAGTLGMKHDPALLLRLAEHFREDEDVRVVVVSQGLGAEWLREQKQQQDLDNLVLMGFQPLASLPDVLATADVLVAVLEDHAATFSVPSKVLTYLCAGRPLLLAVPHENRAAEIVAEAKAGFTVPPARPEALLAAAEELIGDEDLRTRMGRNARAYAERAFDVEAIADRFEAVLTL